MASLRGGNLRQVSGQTDLISVLESDQSRPDDDPSTRNGGLDPSREQDIAQLQMYAQLRQQGAISDKGWQRLIQRNPRSAVLLSSVSPSRDVSLAQTRATIGNKYFSPDQNVVTGPEDDQMVRFKPGKADVENAYRAALAAGDVEFANQLVKPTGGQNLYGGIQYAFDPQTKQYVPYSVDERTRQSVPIQTPPGTVATVPVSPTPGIGPQGPGFYQVPTRSPASGGSQAVPGVTPLPTTEEAKSVGQAETATEMANRLKGYVEKKQVTVGPVYGRALRAKALTGIGDLSTEEADTLSIEQALSNQLLQAMRGAQVGPKEQEMFNKQLPQIDQPEALFKANIKNTMKNLATLQQAMSRQRPIKTNTPKEQVNVETTKVIGGKTYVKVNGKWFEK